MAISGELKEDATSITDSKLPVKLFLSTDKTESRAVLN
jgi:hypothetical protein